MHRSVVAAWPEFVERWEGRVPHMYLDTLKFVTFGVGRKIEDDNTISTYGLTRPWRDASGALVLEESIRAEWGRINARTDLAPKGGRAFGTVASLHLNDADITEALMDTTRSFWSSLLRALPGLDGWPADAQLAIMDMSYHMGPAFVGPRWPNFTAAAKAGDMTGCAAQCQTAKKSPRDAAHARLFTNAAAVIYAGLDREKLWSTGLVPMVTTWKPPGKALTRVDASNVAKAKPGTFSPDAWYVQRMLAQAKCYRSPVDGLWGNVSKAALATWAKSAKRPNRVDPAVLGALSRATLRMPVVP